jgi:hypothetical protein
MDKKPQKRGNEAYTRIPTLIYTTSSKQERGRYIIKRRYIFKGSYPFPLMSKGERNIRRERGST